MKRRLVAVVVVVVGALAACTSASRAPCNPGGDGTYVDATYDDLARYCVVAIQDGDVVPLSARVIPYEVSTPLFSDYATKRRTVWMPPGGKASYSETEVFDFPSGTILTKSFGFPRDPAQANGPIRWMETRVLVRGSAGWSAVSYLWNDAQTTAKKQPGGTVRAMDVRALDGSVQHAEYLVPSEQQCPKCHVKDDMPVVPIGPRAGALRDQLRRWTDADILAGVPATPAVPFPAWDDRTIPVNMRARAYLDGNCAYCHNPKGEARTTGLFLTFDETDPTRIGRCKPPVAAGGATANLRFDVVPGQPDASILLHRMLATEPAIAMPEIGRSVVHTEAVDLVRAWIAGMSGDCSGK